ncbi:MAG TPA: clostripain-related cysteine peptidase [Pyrinomonadaceae bacterium]|nr:clostripain-related cysteine peptidase [Pyrinomonadaceae bacterium]
MSEPKEWTIMFLLAGDSGISASMISQLKAITDAGFQRDTNVLVYFDPNCNGINAQVFNVNSIRRESFKKKGKATVIGDGEDPYVRNISEDCHRPGLTERSAPESLHWFLNYSRMEFPAKNYMLFLCGHGGVVANDKFLPDSDDGSAITLPGLGKILRSFGGHVRADDGEFHLVGFHSCSMSSVELAYELQGSARFMIGTQGYAFPGSWPYRQLLKKIFRAISRYEHQPVPDPDVYPNKLEREILDGVQDLSFYNSVDFWLAGFSSDISICNLDKIAALDSALQNLARALTAGVDEPTTKGYILRAHLESQSYWAENYTDLYDLCDRLTEYCSSQDRAPREIRNACTAVMDQLRREPFKEGEEPKGAYDRLIVYSDFFGPAYQYSNGLSIYFPWRAPSQTILNGYSKYRFHEKAGAAWLKFLNEYAEKTQREVRSWPSIVSQTNGKARPADVIAATARTAVVMHSGKSGALDRSDKSSGALDRSDKSSGALEPSDKSSGALEPSDKSSGALEPSDKSSGALEPSDKSSGALEPSDKSSGALEPSDKSSSSLGLFGMTVIKNFKNPRNAVVTSRPKGHPWSGPRSQRNGTNGYRQT